MAQLNSGRRLIFIGGSPRSGTTLIQNMLDSHPAILGGPEFLHLKDIIDLRRKLHYSISQGWIDIFCTKDDVDNLIISTINRIFLPFADENQCEFYSEKTPENILVFSELIELFPEAHFIQVIRDPRAIVSSMQQVKKRAINKGLKPPHYCTNITESTAYIKKCFDAGFKASKNSPDKVLTVIFEKLLINPERETKRICSFLGIEWNDLILRPADKEHLGEQPITIKSNEIWYDSKTYNRNPDNRNIAKWHSELALGQQIITTLAFMGYRDLIQAGYDLSVDSITQVNHILSRSYFLCLRLAKVLYRSFSFVVRKIPGISFIRNGFLAVARFLG
jgi:hypothetical protein